MSESIVLIGGKGHAQVIIDCIRAAGGSVFGILDDNIAAGTTILGVPVLGNTTDWQQYREHPFLIAVGNNAVRRKFAEQLCVRWATVIHPTAIVSAYCKIAPGTVVMPGAIINSCASIGQHCIINTGTIVEHDDVLKDYVHLSPRVALGGTVTVGEGSHVGIGACIRNNICVCDNCIIGAGAVVVKDLTEPGTYVGIPARRMV